MAHAQDESTERGYMPASTTPEQGQIVIARNRQYVVTGIAAGSLPPNPIHPTPPEQHLLTLLSVEDDGLGESMQVIWELEPGAHALDNVNLPNPARFDSAESFTAFIDAVRWGAISASDTRQLQAPFRSGVEIEDYQLDPLVRAIQLPRANLLIADDVGLGKTIEAGLIVQEFIVRARARTVLIVCPAGLQIHWRDQMRDKFGLEFRIIDSNLMKQLRRSRGIHVNPWSHFPRLITSIDFIKRDRPLRLFKELLPNGATYPRKFDILIVDEAHNVAPSGSGKYAVDSMRTLAVRTIVPHFEHRLFLSATPHNGYEESFSALLELLDNQRFARGVRPSRQQLSRVMVRRLKSDLRDEFGNEIFAQRLLEAIEVEYDATEREVHGWLRQYSRLRQQNAGSESERYATEFVLKLLKKRLFSSPAAFAATLDKHQRTLRGEREQKASKARLSGVLRRQIGRIEEDYADDDEYEDAAAAAAATASTMMAQLSPEERDLLKRMQQWAATASYKRDCKTRALIDWLKHTLRPDGHWNDERVIIFTEYRATQNWLQTILAAEGFTDNNRLLTIYGGMNSDEREAIKAAFQADPQHSAVRILLATDAASEGIDLQNHCHRLIHMEIPWNPNRLEQRNGRIDRHGQRFNPLVYHFVAAGYDERMAGRRGSEAGSLEADLEFLMRAAEKVERIREDLGKVGPVIAAQVEAAMLGKRLTLETDAAEREAAAVRRMLKFERDLAQQIEAMHRLVWEMRHDLDLEPERIKRVVDVALELAGQPPLERGPEPGLFYLPPLSGTWAACSEGLAHPHTGEIRPITFDHARAKRRDDVVLAHLNHRLVQMSLRLLRAEVWSPEATSGLNRATIMAGPNHLLEHPVVIAHARLVVTGGDQHRLHEEIITAGGWIRPNATRPFRRIETVGGVQGILKAAYPQTVSDRVGASLLALWPTVQPGLVAALEARMRDRTRNMEDRFIERAEEHTRDIKTVLEELAATIRAELDDALAPQQLQLQFEGFNDDERTQLTRNVEALRARLAQIPGEISAEQQAIEQRYLEPTPRLFPVAVTFIVPERMT